MMLALLVLCTVFKILTFCAFMSWAWTKKQLIIRQMCLLYWRSVSFDWTSFNVAQYAKWFWFCFAHNDWWRCNLVVFGLALISEDVRGVFLWLSLGRCWFWNLNRFQFSVVRSFTSCCSHGMSSILSVLWQRLGTIGCVCAVKKFVENATVGILKTLVWATQASRHAESQNEVSSHCI